jgi:hypothetical protein
MAAKRHLLGVLLAATASAATAQVPYTFSNQGGQIPAEELDSNFAYLYGLSLLGTVLNVASFGASGSSQTTTGAIGAGQVLLTLASAQDFKNGQGVRIDRAGAPFSQAAPTSLAITQGGAAGTTRYWYAVAALDYAGGVGAAITAVSTTTGNATLSATNYNSLSWSGSAPAYAVYGLATTASTPPSGLPLLGFTSGTSWEDVGGSAEAAPDWLPTVAQPVAVPDFLVATIISGGGTTRLQVSAPANQLASSAYVAHDDTAAIQNAFNAATGAGGTHAVFIPPSAACYPITTTLTISDTVPIEIYGAGRSAACVEAQSVMGAMLYKGTTFTRGGRIMDMTFAGSGLASFNLYFAGGANYHLERLNLYDVNNLANLRIGQCTTTSPYTCASNAQEFSIVDIRAGNGLSDSCSSPSCFPFTNLWMQGANNSISFFDGYNATYANIDEDPNGAGNHYVNAHGFNYPVNILPQYNLVLGGFQSTSFGFEADGASTAGAFVAGYANVLQGSTVQFDSVTAQEGIQIASGVNGNVVHGNMIYGTTLANGVVQTGASNLNSVCDNMVASSGGANGLATYSNYCN